ncbi:MAG: hypothetical protein HN731_10815 [Rhodospirillaceae bacterium]|jgi:hypothetical protein|nr:hypothetical protein [Rhodospirillaceae bacterium]
MAIAPKPSRPETKVDQDKLESFIGAESNNNEVAVKPEIVADTELKTALNFTVPLSVKKRFSAAKFYTEKTQIEILVEALELWEKKNMQDFPKNLLSDS